MQSCGKQYVCQTLRRIKDRFYEHIRGIDQDKPLGLHVSSMKHEQRYMYINLHILEFIKKSPWSPQALIIRYRVGKKIHTSAPNTCTTWLESRRLDISLDMTKNILQDFRNNVPGTSPTNGGTHNQFQLSYQFSLLSFWLVCPMVFSHMDNIHVAVCTHLDPPRQWQHIVNTDEWPSMKKAHGCGSPIQILHSSPLWTTGWMKPLVICDWWVWKNKTANILTPSPLIELIGPGNSWGLHGAADLALGCMNGTSFG